MERIERYIEKLLLTHDCVILPDFGGFVAHYEPSYQAEEDGAFFPPVRSLSFNPKLTINDGLLVQAYMQTYDITYPEASGILKQEIEQIRSTLNSTGEFLFENIGKITLEGSNRLVYSPNHISGVASPELYGLESFQQSEYVMKKEETASPIEDSIFSKQHTHQTGKNKNYYVIRLNKTFTHYAAAAIVAVVSFLTFSSPVINTQNKEQGLTASSPFIYNIPLTYKPAATPKQIAVNTTAVKKEAPQQEVVSDTPYYTIVLASAIKKNNAQTFIGQLNKAGLKEACYIMDKHMSRVIYSKYDTETSAYQALRRLRAHAEFSEAWILRIIP